MEWKNHPTFGVYDGSPLTAIYNAPPGQGLDTGQRNAGPSQPRISRAGLRALLAGHYRHYLQQIGYFDFATVPWEILEGYLTPQAILDNPVIHNPRFELDPAHTDHGRCSSGRILEYIRHKKAHGCARSPGNEAEVEGYRVATILQFLSQTIKAGERLAQFLLDQFWQPIEAAMANEEAQDGLILRKDRIHGGWFVHVANAYFAYLPQKYAYSALQEQDSCTLVITKCDRETGEIEAQERAPLFYIFLNQWKLSPDQVRAQLTPAARSVEVKGDAKVRYAKVVFNNYLEASQALAQPQLKGLRVMWEHEWARG